MSYARHLQGQPAEAELSACVAPEPGRYEMKEINFDQGIRLINGHLNTMSEARKMIQDAIERVNSIGTARIGDLRLGLEGDDVLMITGWLNVLNIESATKSVALRELDQIKHIAQRILHYEPKLLMKTGCRSIKYVLAHEYKSASVVVCFEENGSVVWRLEL